MMTTQLFADTKMMNDGSENEQDRSEGRPVNRPHEPRHRRAETPAQRRARIEAITRAVRNGTYDTEARARLAADSLFRALTKGR
jgi:hypothetical protein